MQFSSKSSKGHSSKMRVNFHGMIGLVAIALVIGVAFQLRWNIVWWYFVLSILLYSISIISLTFLKGDASTLGNHLVFRFLLGCHLAFLFLAGGLWLNFPNFFVQAGIFWHR